MMLLCLRIKTLSFRSAILSTKRVNCGDESLKLDKQGRCGGLGGPRIGMVKKNLQINMINYTKQVIQWWGLDKILYFFLCVIFMLFLRIFVFFFIAHLELFNIYQAKSQKEIEKQNRAICFI